MLVSELKKVIEGILKIPPEDQMLYVCKDDQVLGCFCVHIKILILPLQFLFERFTRELQYLKALCDIFAEMTEVVGRSRVVQFSLKLPALQIEVCIL